MFGRLTRWLHRLIPFNFEREHMPGAKIGLEEYLSRHPNSEAKPVSAYDSKITVAQINSIQSALGYETKLSKGPETVHHERNNNPDISNWKIANQKTIVKFCKRISPVEGKRCCKDKSTTWNADTPLRLSNEAINRLVGAITTCKNSRSESTYSKNSISSQKRKFFKTPS